MGAERFQRADTVARFVYRGVTAVAKSEKNKDPAVRGLFVLFQVTPEAGQPVLADFELAMTDGDGVLRIVPPDVNPWALAMVNAKELSELSSADRATYALVSKSCPSVITSPRAYTLCFVAHPSPEYARAALSHLRNGKGPDGRGTWTDGFRPRQLTPEAGNDGLTFATPMEATAYVPGGPAAYGGWLLYRHMPYGLLPEVATQTRKLAVKLGRLRYPAGLGGPDAPEPYPANEGEHHGVFDAGLQAALHRFQRDAAAGKGFLVDESAGAALSDNERAQGWGFLHGTPDAPAPSGAIEPSSSLDDATADLLEQWLATPSLRAPVSPMVRGSSGRNYADPELWWRFWALEEVCKALGAVYAPAMGGTHRTISAAGRGQISTSNHKLGRALDMSMAGYAEPSPRMPVAFEAQMRPNDGPRWLVYMHSKLDARGAAPEALATELAGALFTARTKLSARIEQTMAKRRLPVGDQVLLDFEALSKHLLELAATPGEQGSSTALGREFFRESVQRFQWQGGQADIGDVMPPVTAVEDAVAQGLTEPVRSFLNLTRLAFRLGLQSIGTQSGYAPPVNSTSSTVIVPGKASGATAKAVELDRLADGIEAALMRGVPVTVNPGKKEKKLDASTFDVEAIRNWITRPSDDPGAPRPVAMEYADGGVDLIVQVQLDAGDAKQLQLAFLDGRGSTKAKVVSIGRGLGGHRLEVDAIQPIRDMTEQLARAVPVAGSRDRFVRLRPNFYQRRS